MESRQSIITRTLLEANIEAARAKLDDARKRKAYTEADPLQKYPIELLVKKRRSRETPRFCFRGIVAS